MPSIIAAKGVRFKYARNRRRHAGTAYKKRDKICDKLGFASYRDYLKSPLWKAIRSEVLRLYPVCEICEKSKSTQGHHVRYSLSVMNGKNIRPIVGICGKCHREIEFKPSGEKRYFETAMKRTKRLLKKNGRWELHKGKPENDTNAD